MTVKDIVKKYLEDNGFEGLGCEYCCCGLEDLMPCDGCSVGGDVSTCKAGYIIPCDPETCTADGDCPFHIGERS